MSPNGWAVTGFSARRTTKINFSSGSDFLSGGSASDAAGPRQIRPAAFWYFGGSLLVAVDPLNRVTLTDCHSGHNLVLTRVDELSLVFVYVFAVIAFLGEHLWLSREDTAEK
jgi:hypothetical protein